MSLLYYNVSLHYNNVSCITIMHLLHQWARNCSPVEGYIEKKLERLTG